MSTVTVEDYLAHYGVKGMKWGVRRTPSQLAKASRKKADRLDRKANRADRRSGRQARSAESEKAYAKDLDEMADRISKGKATSADFQKLMDQVGLTPENLARENRSDTVKSSTEKLGSMYLTAKLNNNTFSQQVVADIKYEADTSRNLADRWTESSKASKAKAESLRGQAKSKRMEAVRLESSDRVTRALKKNVSGG